MKPGSPPPPLPDDEAADPLLAALRERLGDYAQAPPPGAWAAIRRQVAPAALPQPWWRRRSPLVLLGLLLCCLLPGTLGEYTARYGAGRLADAGQPQYTASSNSSPTPTNALGKPTARGGRTMRRPATPVAARRAAPLGSSASNRTSALPETPAKIAAAQPQTEATKLTAKSTTGHPTAMVADRHTASQPKTRRQLAIAKATKPDMRPAPDSGAMANIAPRKTPRLAVALADSRNAPRRRLLSSSRPTARRALASEPETAIPLAESGATKLSTGRLTSHARRARTADAAVAHAANAAAARSAYAQKSSPETATHFAAKRGALARRQARHSGGASGRSGASASQPTAAAADATALAAPLAAFSANDIFPFGPVDLLALKQLSLPVPDALPLATLVARPDSTPPVPPVRRWALLVVAGPTLSYRTLGPAPTLATGHPDFARVERPALGLGAQVQVRRVLSGRWALAVGLGYNEYATGLALSLKDTVSVHQRDTYRLFTVPVQVSYALGAPRGRLSKALLLGAEPGWYLGGRSTEGSGCGCEQQTYTSAASSPYRSLTVTFSLGLDLRYRLGSAGSRWQWLVQPTGRYVATPFVRSEAVGFTQRQPFSLGLLTGFSWDVR